MGGFCTPSYTELPTASETVSGTDIPEWMSTAGRAIFESAANIAGQEQELFTGDRLANYEWKVQEIINHLWMKQVG